MGGRGGEGRGGGLKSSINNAGSIVLQIVVPSDSPVAATTYGGPTISGDEKVIINKKLQELFHSFVYAMISWRPVTTVLHRNKLTLRFGCGSCGLRLRFVRFAVRAICGCGSCNSRLRFVRFFHRPQKTMESRSDFSRLQRLSYAF